MTTYSALLSTTVSWKCRTATVGVHKINHLCPSERSLQTKPSEAPELSKECCVMMAVVTKCSSISITLNDSDFEGKSGP